MYVPLLWVLVSLENALRHGFQALHPSYHLRSTIVELSPPQERAISQGPHYAQPRATMPCHGTNPAGGNDAALLWTEGHTQVDSTSPCNVPSGREDASYPN